jgi:hypothetical protein
VELKRSRARVVLAGFFVGLMIWPIPALAARGDFLPAGTGYCASTYPGHPRPFPNELWGPSVDLNEDGGDQGRPVLAPADGKVLVWTSAARTYDGDAHDGWGNSLVWISADGHEQLFVAHLSRILVRWPQQRVHSGQTIGLAGNTGHVGGSGADGGAHLHVNRMVDWKPAPVILSGHVVAPALDPGADCTGGPHHYVSVGPDRDPARCAGNRTGLTVVRATVTDPEGRLTLRPTARCTLR